MPTADELRCMTYLSIVHGATGVMYFSFDYNGRLDQYHPQTWSAVKDIAGEIAVIEGALTADLPSDIAVSATNDGAIDIKLFANGSHYYLIAVNHEDAAVSGVQFMLEGASGQADVLFESRLVSITGSSWSDDFGAYGVHVYKVAQ